MAATQFGHLENRTGEADGIIVIFRRPAVVPWRDSVLPSKLFHWLRAVPKNLNPGFFSSSLRRDAVAEVAGLSDPFAALRPLRRGSSALWSGNRRRRRLQKLAMLDLMVPRSTGVYRTDPRVCPRNEDAFETQTANSSKSRHQAKPIKQKSSPKLFVCSFRANFARCQLA